MSSTGPGPNNKGARILEVIQQSRQGMEVGMNTVDGRNPAPFGMYKTLRILGYLQYYINWLAGFLPSTVCQARFIRCWSGQTPKGSLEREDLSFWKLVLAFFEVMKWIFWPESDRTWSNSCQFYTPERIKHSWRFQLGFSNLLEDWFFLAECNRTLFSLLTRYPGDPLGQAFVAGVQNEWVVKSVALTGRTWCSVRWLGSDSPEVSNWSLRERRW